MRSRFHNRMTWGLVLGIMVLALVLAPLALASSVDESIVDTTAPTGSVSIAPGGSGSITINMTVTGNQVGTATFDVYRDWTLSGGTFTGSNLQTFTVPPRAAGDPATTFSTSGTVSVASGQAGGTFTLAVGAINITNTNQTGAKLNAGSSSSYKVTVAPPSDTTLPVITPNVSGTLGNNDWYVSDVTVSWSVVDNESAISSSSGCGSTTITSDTAGTTLTCTATSAGGTSSQSVTIKRDATAPTISGAPDRVANSADWYNADVTVSFTCSDALSGVASCSGSSTLGEGADQSVTGIVTDQAGNTASATVSGINIDKTAPTASASASPAPNANGWNNTDVTVSFTGSDSLSGKDSCSADVVLSNEGAGQSASGTCTDKAGNVSAQATASGINIDKTKPVISFVSRTPANGNGWNNSDVTVNWSCSDGLSDVVAATVSQTMSTEGANQSATGTCTDNAGNTASNTQIGINIDKTAPTISGAPDRAANAEGWYNNDVTVSFTCADTLSGVVSCSGPSILGEGAGQSVTGTATDQAGNSASATVSGINIDKTAPTASASASPAANANGWNNTDVTVSFSGNDGLSGIASCSSPVVLSSDGAGQSASGTCRDKADNVSTPATASGINIDKTAPAASASVSPAANANGWNKTDVTVSFSGTDSLSGIDFCDAAVVLNTEGTGQSASGTCTDKAGNVSAPATASGINIDKTAPTANASASPAANANGWNNTNVTVSFSGSDGLSDIDFCDAAVVLSSEGAGQSASGTCTDKAGNVSATATASGINIDKTAPTVSLVGGPADGASYYFGFVPAAPTCSVSDALSGLDGACSISGYSTALGSHPVTASAKDKAGNQNTASVTYTVLAWTLSGFYQPVDMNGVYNTVKNGSTIPLKFEIFAGPTELTDISSISSLKYGQTPCDATAPTAEIETAATGGTSLRYDTTAGQFVYNWKTPAAGCYRVTMTTRDGSTLQAYFKLR